MSASPLNRRSGALYGAELTQPGYQQRIAESRTFHGRQAIEELYAKHYFGEVHSKNVVTVVNEAIAAGNELRATGTWSDTFEEPSAGTIHAEGTYSWVLFHEGDTWRIRESTYDITNMRQ
jgi:hypothetical protein